jgi:hypothetical protein
MNFKDMKERSSGISEISTSHPPEVTEENREKSHSDQIVTRPKYGAGTPEHMTPRERMIPSLQ